MLFLLGWCFFSFCVAFVFGIARTIGFWVSLLMCLILSPIIGLFVTLLFKTNEEDRRAKEMLAHQRNTMNAMRNNKINVATEMEKLVKLKESGNITGEEYEQMKSKLLS